MACICKGIVCPQEPGNEVTAIDAETREMESAQGNKGLLRQDSGTVTSRRLLINRPKAPLGPSRIKKDQWACNQPTDTLYLFENNRVAWVRAAIFITGLQSDLSAILKIPRRLWVVGVKRYLGIFLSKERSGRAFFCE